MKLEISKINTLTLSWTIVHVINEESPFYNLTKEDLINAKAEILVFVKAFDESFSNTVVSRSSYVASEMVFGAKFRVMYHRSEDDTKTILNIDQLNDFDEVELPVSNSRLQVASN
jgi:inward rectifier potassium channel